MKNNFNQMDFDSKDERDTRFFELRESGMMHVYRDTTSVLDENGKGKMVYRVRWPERYEDDLHSGR